MQQYAYDTKMAQKLKIPRDPEHNLRHMGWDGIKMGEPDENGIILFTAEKVVIPDLFNPPKHITPVAN